MNQQFDWIALRAHPGARVGWLAVLISASALLYFLTLSATGMRLKDFKRKT
jgi:putative peptidoglycan lipid II flippase